MGTQVSGTFIKTNIDKHILGPELHPLDILRTRKAQEIQTERRNQYEISARRDEAIRLLEKRKKENLANKGLEGATNSSIAPKEAEKDDAGSAAVPVSGGADGSQS